MTVSDFVDEFLKVTIDEGRTCLAVTTSSNYACVPSYDGAMWHVSEGKSVVTSQVHVLDDPLATEYDVLLLHKDGSIARIDVVHDDGCVLSYGGNIRKLARSDSLLEMFLSGEFNDGDTRACEEMVPC